MRKELLPIGSVVLLKEGTKKIMITGFCPVAKGETEMHDYAGCLYPEGIIESDKNLVFNHDQIDEIYFIGFINIEEQDFKNKLYKELSEKENNTEKPNEEVGSTPLETQQPMESPKLPEETQSLEAPQVASTPMDIPAMEDILPDNFGTNN